ncbi:MAG: hypothetical protein EA411_03050 [Saprospirales bacterium]|nr:MAG: hypothetical protein EA411_03050 [Saprospirales bacterium]
MFPIVDLHAHPQLKPLNAVSPRQQRKGLWEEYTGRPACDDLNFLLRSAVSDIKKTSQANFDQATEADVRGIFLALGPVERNFFDPKPRHFLLKMMLLDRHLERFASCITGFDLEKVDKIFKRVRERLGIDYYTEELLPEYQFLMEEASDERVVIAGDHEEFEHAFEAGNTIANILTVEGAHSLGNYEEVEDFWRPVKDADREEIHLRLLPHFDRNIAHMKKWGQGRHTPFFITFCHHFSNLLAGHSRSFPEGGIGPGMAALLDQRNGLNEGISKLGRDVLDLLLSGTNGRRVLIDIKHMSVKTRIEYFSLLKERYWDRGFEMPVIASHAALNGYKTLGESLKPDSRRAFRRHYLSRQVINSSDEEARIIVQSGGLAGIVFHGGRLPGGRAKRQLKRARNQDEQRDAAVELIMSNVFQFVRAADRPEAWDCLALGTDMDGVIEPLFPYENYRKLVDFPIHIKQFFYRPFDLKGIEMPASDVRKFMFGKDPEELTEKLCNGNVLQFLRRFFSDEFLLERA